MPMKNVACVGEGCRESTMVNENFRLKELRKADRLLVNGRQRGVGQKVMPAERIYFKDKRKGMSESDWNRFSDAGIWVS